MLALKYVAGLLVLIFIGTFAAKNQQSVDVSYYMGYEYNVQLWVALLAAVGFGIVIAGAGWGISLLKEKNRNWKLARKLKKLEEEVKELKRKPLPDESSVYPPQPSDAATPAALAGASKAKAITGRVSASE